MYLVVVVCVFCGVSCLVGCCSCGGGCASVVLCVVCVVCLCSSNAIVSFIVCSSCGGILLFVSIVSGLLVFVLLHFLQVVGILS